MGENSWKREKKAIVKREDIVEYSEERMKWKSWNRGWKRMLGRNVGMEGLEEWIEVNVRKNSWDGGIEERMNCNTVDERDDGKE